MENNNIIRPLTPTEKQFASDNYHLITKFLKCSKLDVEEFFDIVVLDFLLSVEKYLNDEYMQNKCSFETFSYMYMKRAIFVHFRKEKALKRSSIAGADISFDSIDTYIGKTTSMENISVLEYMEKIKEIRKNLTTEQWKIFIDKLEGYTLKEISYINGINQGRVYKQFGKIKMVVADVMEI